MPASDRPGPEVVNVERFVTVEDDDRPLDLLVALPAALFMAAYLGNDGLAELVTEALDLGERDVADGLTALAFVVSCIPTEVGDSGE